MTEARPGGRRRIDRILTPDFTEALGDLGLGELRRRRDLARAERDYLSFLRRLVQGRLDILTAERERRRAGDDAGSIVDRLPAILAEGTRGASRGEAPAVAIGEDEVSLARRRVERLVSSAALSAPSRLSDEQLDEAVGRLQAEERRVSDVRRSVLGVHDALQDEVKRRYRARLEEGAG